MPAQLVCSEAGLLHDVDLVPSSRSDDGLRVNSGGKIGSLRRNWFGKRRWFSVLLFFPSFILDSRCDISSREFNREIVSIL